MDALIEGSVLREGGQVRITAQLIQASTYQHLWAESYQRDLRSVVALQGELASAIAGRIIRWTRSCFLFNRFADLLRAILIPDYLGTTL